MCPPCTKGCAKAVVPTTARKPLRNASFSTEPQMEDATIPPPDFCVAVVARLFPDEGYGFLSTLHGGEVPFTRAVVLREEFDELRIGSEVRYEAIQHNDGLTATVVDLMSIPYPDTENAEEQLADDDELPEFPDEWQEK